MPPDDLLPARTRRATPYLYTPQEVADLMHATEILRGSHVQATYRTLIGLLAVTGMRIVQLLVARITVSEAGLAIDLRHDGRGAIAALMAPPRKEVA